ncbi:hypothetical protein IWX49DRAFT_204142 [Phyllosticta citricarpa]|uniref:Kelch repeat protein n=2 Tax=Phyllosticta TaxID=121621 RepID=A0ABR1M013_9PEZI
MPLVSGNWTCLLQVDALRRSSQALVALSDKVAVFGGEIRPRQPVDNHVHLVPIGTAGEGSIQSVKSEGTSPSPRVGTAAISLEDELFLFSGRGGEAMAPIEERGALWSFDASSTKWSLITPANSEAPFPPARSYHALGSDGHGTIFLHAGCPEAGRLSDLWSFTLSTRSWKKLADAPDPPRGGTSIAFLNGKLYRMNGFDGKTEQGGSVDVYDPQTDAWSSIKFTPDGFHGPEPRSVAALLAVYVAQKPSLLTLFGERDPSSLGHMGAGKMLDDAWLFDLGSEKWSKVQNSGADKYVSGSCNPQARGWFSATVQNAERPTTVFVHGGLGEDNQRLGDLWQLDFGP